MKEVEFLDKWQKSDTKIDHKPQQGDIHGHYKLRNKGFIWTIGYAQFPNCCGSCVLYNFPEYDLDNDEQIEILKDFISFVIDRLVAYRPHGEGYYEPYSSLIVTLTEDQEVFIGIVKELGFKKAEATEFLNRNSDNIVYYYVYTVN